jgi:hypothetical protein
MFIETSLKLLYVPQALSDVTPSDKSKKGVPIQGVKPSTQYMLLLLIGLQDPPAKPEPKPDFVRKLKAKNEYIYRVELTTIAKEIARYDYTMRLKVGARQGNEGDWPMDVVLQDLTSEVGGKQIKRDTFGSVALTIGDVGFPKGLTFLGTTLPFSMPLLSLFLPEKPDLQLEFVSPPYDGSITFKGKATVKKGAEHSVWMDARVHIANEPKDDSMFRKLNITSIFDPKDGALLRATGKYVAADGTVNFRLTRQSR